MTVGNMVDELQAQHDRASSVRSQNLYYKDETSLSNDNIMAIFNKDCVHTIKEIIEECDILNYLDNDLEKKHGAYTNVVYNIRDYFTDFIKKSQKTKEDAEEFKENIVDFFEIITDINNASKSKIDTVVLQEAPNKIIQAIIDSCRSEEDSIPALNNIIELLCEVVPFDELDDIDKEGLESDLNDYATDSFEDLQNDELQTSYEDNDWD